MSEESDRQLGEAIRVAVSRLMEDAHTASILRQLAQLILPDLAEHIGSPKAELETPVHTEASSALTSTTSLEAEMGGELTPIESLNLIATGSVPLVLGGAALQVTVRGVADEFARARSAAERAVAPSMFETSAPRILQHDQPDLSLVPRRCEMKARSCLLAIQHRQENELTLNSECRDLIGEARQISSCFLWAFMPQKPVPPDDRLKEIGACYRNLGAATECILESSKIERPITMTDLLHLAEAQSALRVALGPTWLTAEDADQGLVFSWLKHFTQSRRMYVDRFMTLDDPGEPAQASLLSARVQGVAQQVREFAVRLKSEREALNRVRHHAKRLATSENAAHDEAKIVAGLTTLRDCEYKLSLLAGVLAPIRRLLPESDLTSAVFAGSEDTGDDESDANEGTLRRTYSVQVARVRELLRSGRVVIIGGEPREDAIKRFVDAFELADVDWLYLPEHGSGAAIKPAIANDRTLAVLAIVKLAGHLHIDEARKAAKLFGRPLVMLHGGYNPEQVAEQIVVQTGERLGLTPSRAI